MTQPVVGFIGFGEAGFAIGSGLRSAGVQQIYAYDIAADWPDRGPLIRQRAQTCAAVLVESQARLASVCDVLFSTVTCSSALEAARQNAPHLTPRHLYADLNSVSPELKREIAETIAASGAAFVEAAVMAPVHPQAHRVPMLLGGPDAAKLVELMAPFGMRLEVLSGPVGTAAAVKMCRSIVVKGLEALLCECVLGASRYGADALVFASLDESYPGVDWKQLADYTIGRVVVHGERRAREMEEVAATLRAIGVEPIMAEATARRQEWSAALNLKAHFGPEGPGSYREVLEVLAARNTPDPVKV